MRLRRFARTSPRPNPERLPTWFGLARTRPAINFGAMFILRIESGDGQGQEIPLEGAAVLGRVAECELRIKDDKASRQHARVKLEGQGWVLEDLKSRNGTYLNGKRVQREPIKAGDRIGIGDCVIRFLEQTPAAGPAVAAPVPRSAPAPALGPPKAIATAIARPAAPPAEAAPGRADEAAQEDDEEAQLATWRKGELISLGVFAFCLYLLVKDLTVWLLAQMHS